MTPPLIDRAVIAELRDGIGAEGARSVLELFIAESAAHVAALDAAAAQPDDADCRDRARRAAHSLKSAAGQVGAARLSAAAAAAEHACAAGAAGVAEAAAALAGSAAETIAALQLLLATGER